MTANRAALKAAAAEYIARDTGCSMWEAEDIAGHIIDLALEEAVRAVCDAWPSHTGPADILADIRALKGKP